MQLSPHDYFTPPAPMADFDESMMRRALSLAKRGVGKTSPNPAVGCVIVRDGRIVGQGWHRKAGTPHAEVHALHEAGDLARGADVYVTLEPCSHFGKTPPCADALIQAGVRRVVIGTADPNPKVNGGGTAKLSSAGIEVISGILEEPCRRINLPFFKHITTGLPYVILKSAMTLDGKTATSTGDSKWISSALSRLYVHRLRSRMDAVMVGIGTVIADDPQLNVRLPGKRREPVRVVVDSTLRIPLHARLLHMVSESPTIIATTAAESEKMDKLRVAGAKIMGCRDHCGRVDLHDLLRQLGEQGVQTVLLEGGRELAGQALRLNLIDRFIFFYAPRFIGGGGFDLFGGDGAQVMADAPRAGIESIRRIGNDIVVEGFTEATCLPD